MCPIGRRCAQDVKRKFTGITRERQTTRKLHTKFQLIPINGCHFFDVLFMRTDGQGRINDDKT